MSAQKIHSDDKMMTLNVIYMHAEMQSKYDLKKQIK